MLVDTDCASRTYIRDQFSFVDDYHTVDEHIRDPDRGEQGLGVRRPIDDRFGIEHRDIGIGADPQSSLVAHGGHVALQTAGRLDGHATQCIHQ